VAICGTQARENKRANKPAILKCLTAASGTGGDHAITEAISMQSLKCLTVASGTGGDHAMSLVPLSSNSRCIALKSSP